MSTEVAVGYGNLMGYELYDLVFLNENESAVIISVGAEKLKVINHLNIVKDVFPQEIQSKRNVQSERSNSFDSQQNTVKVGDTVNVVSGAHAKLSGTVKHIMKGNLWLHSIEYLKTSGVFVVKARNCVVAGNSNAPLPAFSAGYKGVLDGATGASGSRGGGGRGGGGGGGRIGKDSAINQTVKIKKGAYKGLLAQVIDATPTHFHVELLAKLKKVVIERDKAVIVGNTQGSFERQQDRPPEINGAPATPYLTSQTPMYIGSETPRYGIGNETPLGSRTPGRTPGRDGDDDDEMWKVTQDDEIQSSVDDMSYRTGTGYSSTVNGRHSPYSLSYLLSHIYKTLLQIR